jgi:hypothetical protein
MTGGRAMLEYIKGLTAGGRHVARQLAGSPFMLHVRYLGGHPGIWAPGPLWLGRVGGQVRLVNAEAGRSYDLPLDRITQLACSADGRVRIGFEPTPGLQVTVLLQADDPAAGQRHLGKKPAPA